MNIIILSHERSVNKTECLIRYYRGQGSVTLVVESPVAEHKTYTQLCDRIIVVENFEVKKICSHVKACDKILCASENLLEIQAELEAYYGIENVSREAARILSNKYLLDDYARRVGLKEFVPDSSVPVCRQEILSLKSPVILKPDIGTGSNRFLEGDLAGLEYRVWPKASDLIDELGSRGIEDSLYRINREGLENDRFNRKPCRMIVQEFIRSEVPTFGPCGVFREGRAHFSFFVRNIKVDQTSFDAEKNDLNDLHCSSLPRGEFGDFAVYSLDVHQAPAHILSMARQYVESLLNGLQVKELFFAGPDIHQDGHRLGAIDFNPRPGHFFNLLDTGVQGGLMKSLMQGEPPALKEHLLWAAVHLGPRRLTNLSWCSRWANWIPGEAKNFQSGEELPAVSYLQARPRALQLKIKGLSTEDVFRQYALMRCELRRDILEAEQEKSADAVR